MAGRDVLIKAVLQAIPTYIMSCFLIPKTILEEMESLVKQFWWSGCGGKRMAWMA